MTKNTLLNIAILVSRLLKIILIIAAIVLTGLFVYAQIDKETFEDKEIVLSENSSLMGFSILDSNVWKDDTKNAKYDLNPYTFGKLKTISLYVIYIKGLIIMALIYLSITAFEKIVLSVKSLKTFSTNNARLFRKIGKYMIFILILTSYSVLRFESGVQSKMSISFTPFIYVLLAFIMAEIFKEGNSLKQENDLTI